MSFPSSDKHYDSLAPDQGSGLVAEAMLGLTGAETKGDRRKLGKI